MADKKETTPEAPKAEAPAEKYFGPAIEGKPETFPPNLFSGQQKRLDFEGKRPGFAYRWFNDFGSNVNDAIRSGWKFTEREEALLHDAVTPLNKDLGSKVVQHVGIDAAGNALYAYLMEKPEWLVKEHETGPGSREEYHRMLEKNIREGTFAEKPGEMRYSAGRPFEGSQGSLPRISISKPNR
jgi:hypothetical protein